MFKTDAVYDEWINSIPYVQTSDLAAFRARIAKAGAQA
jgi:hypothetical protein